MKMRKIGYCIKEKFLDYSFIDFYCRIVFGFCSGCFKGVLGSAPFVFYNCLNIFSSKRFVVERTNAWFDTFKTILIRLETKKSHWKALNIITFCIILIKQLQCINITSSAINRKLKM